MADKLEIIMEFDEDTGEVTMDAVGFKGKVCEETLNDIQRALQGHGLSSIKKPEYNQMVQEIDKMRVKNSGRYGEQ